LRHLGRRGEGRGREKVSTPVISFLPLKGERGDQEPLNFEKELSRKERKKGKDKLPKRFLCPSLFGEGKGKKGCDPLATGVWSMSPERRRGEGDVSYSSPVDLGRNEGEEKRNRHTTIDPYVDAPPSEAKVKKGRYWASPSSSDCMTPEKKKTNGTSIKVQVRPSRGKKRKSSVVRLSPTYFTGKGGEGKATASHIHAGLQKQGKGGERKKSELLS